MISIIINGQNANVENIETIGFKTDFTGLLNEQEVNVDSLVLVNESKQLIHDWISTNGAFIGIPTQIVYGTLTFDYYIDLTDNPIFSDYSVEVKIKKRGANDSFFNVANALSFELLNARGVQFPTINVPYVIVKDNQLEVGIVLALAIFTTSQAIYKAVQELLNIAAEFSGALALSPGLAISAGTKLILQLTYIGILVAQLIDLVAKLRELIFPKIRYFKACKVVDLIRLGCENIGYTFSSNALSALDLTILPVPLQKANQSIFKFTQNELNNSFTKGYPTGNDTTPTLGQLISSMLDTFALKFKARNNQVQIETKQFFSENSTFSVAPALNVQDRRENEYTLNTSDANLRTYLHYQTDFNDLHTLDNFEPTDAEYGLKNLVQSDNDLKLLKGLKDVNIPFSLGVRKSEFNAIEQLCFNLFTIVDAYTGLETAASIENRLGVLQVSQQFYGVTKLLKCDVNGKQPENYLNTLRASAIYYNYHQQYEIQINGFKRYENAPVLMNFAEYEQILNSNFADVDGVQCEILDLLHIPYSSEAIITYLFPFNYENGKITNFAINE
jgi:hypothetical protein